MPQNTSLKAAEFPIQDWQKVHACYTQTKWGMTRTCGNRNSSTSCWNKCHSHHQSCLWTSTVPNKLPTSPTSPEPVQNENLLWASVSVSEFLLSEREIRWRDPRLPTCQVTNESVWLCLTRSQTGTRSWVWRALTLFCLTHCSTLCSSVTHIVSSFPPSIRPLSFRHSKHD